MSAPEKRTPRMAAWANAIERTETHGSVAPAGDVCKEEPAPHEKVLATLSAALALRGHQVHTLASGDFLVCRWGLSRVCPDLTTLRALARQIGAIE